MKKLIYGLLFLVFFCFSSVNAEESQKPLWIDVRTQPEFDSGHVKDAILIPFNIIEQYISDITQDKDRQINLYCRSGARANIALQILNSLGYTNVTNFGGYKRLKSQGVPIIEP